MFICLIRCSLPRNASGSRALSSVLALIYCLAGAAELGVEAAPVLVGEVEDEDGDDDEDEDSAI